MRVEKIRKMILFLFLIFIANSCLNKFDKSGNKHGKWKTEINNGEFISYENYQNGKKVGMWEIYDSLRNKVQENHYFSDSLESIVFYKENMPVFEIGYHGDQVINLEVLNSKLYSQYYEEEKSLFGSGLFTFHCSGCHTYENVEQDWFSFVKEKNLIHYSKVINDENHRNLFTKEHPMLDTFEIQAINDFLIDALPATVDSIQN